MKKKIKTGVIYLLVIVAFVPIGFVGHEYLELSQPGVIVLLYHRVSNEGHSKYILKTSKFKAQLRYLSNHEYRTILPQEIINLHLHSNPKKTIMLTFDDGTIDHYITVYPLLKKYGFKGVFFIISKYINSPGSLSAMQIYEMSRNGMEIGSHTYSHPFLDELSYKQIKYQLKKSKDDLESICKKPIISFAAPGGWFNKDVIRAAKFIGYKAFFGCEIGRNDLRKKPYIYKRIEVYGGISLKEFIELLHTYNSFTLEYKSMQSLKFITHDILGSNNYSRLGKLLK